MTVEELAPLSALFASYLETFSACFIRRPTFKHCHAYCFGLLGDLPRKSVEPIALASDIAVRTLQEFLRDHTWDHQRLRNMMQQRCASMHTPSPGHDFSRASKRPMADKLGVVGIIDEKGHPKKGNKTPGVQRQYCGKLGKVENCIVTVHLAMAWQAFQTILDSDLYLPESWANDRQRCRDADIPEELAHLPKWKIAINQVKRALGNGIRFDWLTFDEGYGLVPEFLHSLDKLGQRYIGEVPSNFHVWARKPKYKSLRKEYSPSTVYNAARWSDPFIYAQQQTFVLKRKTLAPVKWEIKAARVYLVEGKNSHRRPTDRTYWLIHGWQPETDEHKYWISNAPPGSDVSLLLKVAFSRARIEHCFRIASQELGMSHFEGRSYTGLMRHLILCQLVMLFAAEQTDRLRGEKSVHLDRTDCPCVELHHSVLV